MLPALKAPSQDLPDLIRLLEWLMSGVPLLQPLPDSLFCWLNDVFHGSPP